MHSFSAMWCSRPNPVKRTHNVVVYEYKSLIQGLFSPNCCQFSLSGLYKTIATAGSSHHGYWRISISTFDDAIGQEQYDQDMDCTVNNTGECTIQEAGKKPRFIDGIWAKPYLTSVADKKIHHR